MEKLSDRIPTLTPAQLRDVARVLGFDTCGSHEGDIPRPAMELAMLATIRTLAEAHIIRAEHSLTPLERGSAVETAQEVVHNVAAAIGLDPCDDDHHASVTDPDGCCALTVARRP